MHAKREIPASSCPSVVDNAMYASGCGTNQTIGDEFSSFRIMTDMLDERAEKYEPHKARKEFPESIHAKYLRAGIRDGDWCRVDTDGVFEHNGRRYRIDPFAQQYQPIETEIGDLYDMDRILACGGGKFYDMRFDEVQAQPV